MKIPLEAFRIMVPSDSKVYSYTEILSYILFKYKNVGGKVQLLCFI